MSPSLEMASTADRKWIDVPELPIRDYSLPIDAKYDWTGCGNLELYGSRYIDADRCSNPHAEHQWSEGEKPKFNRSRFAAVNHILG
ncbi:MAG: hypothetical protein EA424_01375 [Planctomycetaceae bacterium]|nr:MAG: hypothetical protein EA424_01375 [Planctomycetaceae bacterium]